MGTGVSVAEEKNIQKTDGQDGHSGNTENKIEWSTTTSDDIARKDESALGSKKRATSETQNAEACGKEEMTNDYPIDQKDLKIDYHKVC